MTINNRVIIFFSSPFTDKINKTIKLAKKLNKKVLFDIDNLVIDRKYTNILPYKNIISWTKRFIW